MQGLMKFRNGKNHGLRIVAVISLGAYDKLMCLCLVDTITDNTRGAELEKD